AGKDEYKELASELEDIKRHFEAAPPGIADLLEAGLPPFLFDDDDDDDDLATERRRRSRKRKSRRQRMNLTALESPYKTLGVERTASESEIKQAYFALVREHPPERDPEGFKRIRAAYEKLRAGGERAETDLFLIEELDAAMSMENLHRHGAEPPAITP